MMQAYIANFSENFSHPAISDDSFFIYFSGNNFRCGHFLAVFSEFRNEHLILTKEIKKNIQDNLPLIKNIIFTGGEPCLQRQALLDIARFAKQNGLNVIIHTNGSKPDVLISLLKANLLNAVRLRMPSPLKPDIFEKVTKSGTFFKPVHEIIEDLKHTLSTLKNYEDDISLEITTRIVPSALFRKDDLLNIASYIHGLRCTWNLEQFAPEKDMLNRNLENISPPTSSFLQNLRESCLKEYSGMNIQIKEN